MKAVNSSDYCGKTIKGTEMQLANSGTGLCDVIENADGVPYQLIFGPEPGEGYYLNIGVGIKQLLGTGSGEFTEKLFISLIQEILPLYDHIPSDIATARKKFISGEIKKYRAEFLVVTPLGEKKWISDSSLPLLEEKTGRVVGSMGILFDISEKKQILSHLAIAREKAEESDRFKAAFLQNISHEVRTPLNAIVGFSTLICEPEHDRNQMQQFLDIINNSTDHLLEIMDNIIEVSRLEAKAVTVSVKEVNVNALMQRVYNRFAAKADKKNILLRFEPLRDKGEIVIMSDAFKLLQAINNLLSNAVKFTSSGTVELGYRLNEENIEFFVSDTGIGIPEEYKPRVFSRFFQAEASITKGYAGNGLGLSIAKAYIEMLGGTIWFDSLQGRGSTFSFALPYVMKSV